MWFSKMWWYKRAALGTFLGFAIGSYAYQALVPPANWKAAFEHMWFEGAVLLLFYLTTAKYIRKLEALLRDRGVIVK